MTNSSRPNEEALLHDLQHELNRLKSERVRAVKKRDRIFAIVETGDDTGYSLNVALIKLKRIDDRIEQVRELMARYQRRIKDSA